MADDKKLLVDMSAMLFDLSLREQLRRSRVARKGWKTRRSRIEAVDSAADEKVREFNESLIRPMRDVIAPTKVTRG